MKGAKTMDTKWEWIGSEWRQPTSQELAEREWLKREEEEYRHRKAAHYDMSDIRNGPYTMCHKTRAERMSVWRDTDGNLHSAHHGRLIRDQRTGDLMCHSCRSYLAYYEHMTIDDEYHKQWRQKYPQFFSSLDRGNVPNNVYIYGRLYGLTSIANLLIIAIAILAVFSGYNGEVDHDDIVTAIVKEIKSSWVPAR